MRYKYPGMKERAVPAAATAAREAPAAIHAGAERARVEAEMCVVAYGVEQVAYGHNCIQQQQQQGAHKQHTRHPHNRRAGPGYRMRDVQVPVAVAAEGCIGAA